jgi:membrane-associated phospholipid phosphatase
MRIFFSLILTLSLCLQSFGQAEVEVTGTPINSYSTSFKQKDLALLGTGIGLTVLGIYMVNNTDEVTLEDIAALDPNDIPGFDRGAIYNNSKTAKRMSDIILYAGSVLPFMTYITRAKYQGAAIGIMALETFLISNGLTSVTKAAVKRYRPLNYNPEFSDEDKLKHNTRFSFFSGHASNTAAVSFFSAKVLTDMHPNMKNKWMIWTIAAAIPASISYLRFEAGKHFPSDVIVGYGVGAAVGFLVPTLHFKKEYFFGLNEHGRIGLMVNLSTKKEPVSEFFDPFAEPKN